MEGQSGLSELSVISWVSTVEGCSSSGVPLYTRVMVRISHEWSHEQFAELGGAGPAIM